MQKQTTKFVDSINKSFAIAKDYLLSSAMEQATKQKEELLAELSSESSIKVPLVGSFNAGKSSLLNAFVNRNMLPTDIAPETAISYELYYSDNERVELYRDDVKIGEKPVDQIKSFDVKPGDIAKVFISTKVIKDLADKGITLVDMPGLDSGIEAHNQAIFHYISKGSAFVLLSEVESGNLTTSCINFLSEIKAYNLRAAVLISKIDKKPMEEVNTIKDYIAYQAQKALDSTTFVGCVSSANADVIDFTKFLDSLDCETIVSEKFGSCIKAYIDMLIISIKTQMDIIGKDIQNIDEKIKMLEAEREKVDDHINNNDGESPEKSTQDILDNVAESLALHAEDIATMIVNKEDSSSIQNAIMSYVRPVIINSLKAEGEDFAESLHTVVDNVSKELAEVVSVDTTIFEDAYNKMGLPVIMTQISRLIAKLPHVLGKILGGLLMILADKLPDLIRRFFGKSAEDQMKEIAFKIKTSIIANMTETLRPKVMELVVDQQNRIKAAYRENIENNIKNREQALGAIETQDKAKLEEKISAMKSAVSELEQIKSNL